MSNNKEPNNDSPRIDPDEVERIIAEVPTREERAEAVGALFSIPAPGRTVTAMEEAIFAAMGNDKGKGRSRT